MRRKHHAFSLIEIMVALTVFSISIVVISQSFTNGLLCRINSEKKDPFEADLPFLRKQILDITDVAKIKEGGSVKGIVTGNVTWKGVVVKTNIVNLFKLDVTCTWTRNAMDKAAKEYRQTLYVFQPSWGEKDQQKDLFERKKRLFKSPGGVGASVSSGLSNSSTTFTKKEEKGS
jgi:prepilin-type N-terminal cleavage/methylation domain-containing protein